LASPEDRIETWRGKTMCMAGPIGKMAKLTVNGDRFQLYRQERGDEAAAEPRGCDIFLVGHPRADKGKRECTGQLSLFDR
jgi:hypothetical protein